MKRNRLHGSNHWWRAADQDFAVRSCRVGETVFDMFLGNETDTTFPTGGGVVEDVIDLESRLVEFFEVLAEKDVFLVDICVNERNGGAVGGVSENSTNDLDHRCDACATSDHAQVIGEAEVVFELTLWTFYTDALAVTEKGNMF